MSGDGQIRMSQGYDVLAPKSGEAFPIPCEEWDLLKANLGQVAQSPWGFHTLGSLLVGAALSPLVTLLAGGIPNQGLNRVIAWALVSVCAITGFLCICFAAREKKLNGQQVTNIVAQMELIERRYQRSRTVVLAGTQSLVIRSAKYGLGSATIDVTTQLMAMNNQGRIDVKVANLLAGDPCPGKIKELVVDYTHNGTPLLKTVKENDWLHLP
jgi:hypothetical protein